MQFLASRPLITTSAFHSSNPYFSPYFSPICSPFSPFFHKFNRAEKKEGRESVKEEGKAPTGIKRVRVEEGERW